MKPRNLIIENKQIELLKKLCSKFDLSMCDSLTVSFWGGEPMMNLDFVCNVIEATSKYKFVRYHMYSNGTLEDEFKRLLDKPFIEDIKDRMHI